MPPTDVEALRDACRRDLRDIGRRRAARPTKDEIDEACREAKRLGITVTEMAELTGIQRQWIHKKHLV